MPRTTYVPPVKVRKCCHEGLTDIAGCTSFVEEHALPAYTIGLHECCSAEANSHGYAKPAGWKFLVAEGNGRVFMADLVASPCGTNAEVVSTSDSKYARSVMEEIRGIDQLFQSTLGLPSPVYELRWLSIPSILLEGLWLHAVEGEETSWVHPLLCLCPETREIPLFTFDDLLSIAAGLGKKREAVDDSPEF